jgi:MFS family permease
MSTAVDRGGVAAPTATAAWLIASFFYFYQYVVRSAPSVMAPQLMQAYGLGAAGLGTLLSLFYFAYAPFSLIAGAAMDHLGPKRAVPIAAAAVGLGSFLFATGVPVLAALGSLLEGAGSVFAVVGAVYIASTAFPASLAATLIGATQMIGMAGGAAGLFLVGPAISGGLGWDEFLGAMGFFGFGIAGLLMVFLPPRAQQAPGRTAAGQSWLVPAAGSVWTVFRNPQSILCGLIAGLMFAPTTVFSIVWGVRFLQEDRGAPDLTEVMRSASVSVGWIVGSPLLGALSDHIGRRKPVIVGAGAVLLLCLLLILRGPPGVFPPYGLGFLAGLASGGAMLPYSVIKEANRPRLAGTAAGVISFINVSVAALLGPALGLVLTRSSGGGLRLLGHYQVAFEPLVYGVGLAIVLAMCLRETGRAASPQRSTA